MNHRGAGLYEATTDGMLAALVWLMATVVSWVTLGFVVWGIWAVLT